MERWMDYFMVILITCLGLFVLFMMGILAYDVITQDFCNLGGCATVTVSVGR